MTAPVNVSPVLPSLIKPLIVADFGVPYSSERPGRKITDEKININKQIFFVIQSSFHEDHKGLLRQPGVLS
jgi:hypothetical protein